MRSAYLILYNREVYRFLKPLGILRFFGGTNEERDEDVGSITDHIIIVGINTLGRYLVKALSERNETVLAIDSDHKKLGNLPCQTIHGDARYEIVLEEASLKSARLLVSTLNIENTNNLLSFSARRANIPCSIHAFDRSVVEDLETIGADHLIRSKRDGARQVLRALKSKNVLHA